MPLLSYLHFGAIMGNDQVAELSVGGSSREDGGLAEFVALSEGSDLEAGTGVACSVETFLSTSGGEALGLVFSRNAEVIAAITESPAPM